MMVQLAGVRARIALPVLLTESARRAALVATGTWPDPIQTLEIGDLTELDRSDRESVVDVWERIAFRDDDTDGGPLITGYEGLRYDGAWALWDEDGDRDALDWIFYPSPGRTLTLAQRLEQELDNPEALQAMLRTAPRLDTVSDRGRLDLASVLRAYQDALSIAAKARELAPRGVHAPEDWWRGQPVVTEDLVFINAPMQDDPPVALLRESDPEAFETAARLTREVAALPQRHTHEFAEAVCRRARAVPPFDPPQDSDERLVADWIRPQADAALREDAERQRTAAANAKYERERTAWIEFNGSRRLRLAAERGYRHDGIYRDERLESEIPGFVGSLGKGAEIREVLNPSETALEVESEVLQQVQESGLDGVKVRLVWAVIGYESPHRTGEYVELANYLGRHTVYRPVPQPQDDIPF